MSTPPLDRTYDQHLERLPLRERKKLKTRRAIQDHALRLFGAHGYEATTVEQIAEAAEVSPSTFFRYFPTKEDVVITDEYDPVMAAVFREQPPELTPLDAMRAMFRDVLGQMLTDDRDQIMVRTRLIMSVPALRAKAFDATRKNGSLSVLIELLGERTGRSVDDPEVQVFAWAVMGVLQATVRAWLDSDGTADFLAMIDHNLEFLSRGCPL